MKKTTLAALIINFFAIVACVFCIIKKDEYTASIVQSTIYLLITTSVISILFYVLFDKKNTIVLLIPALLNYGLFLIYQTSLLDGISSTQNSYEVLSLLVNIAYITSLIFALNKKSKWASIIIIVFNSLLIFTNLELVSSSIFSSENSIKIFGFLSLGFICTFTSQLVYFINPLLVKENKEDKIEEQNESNN